MPVFRDPDAEGLGNASSSSSLLTALTQLRGVRGPGGLVAHAEEAPFGHCPTLYFRYEYEQLCQYSTQTDTLMGCQKCWRETAQKQRLEMVEQEGGFPFPICVNDGAPVSMGGGCETCGPCTA